MTTEVVLGAPGDTGYTTVTQGASLIVRIPECSINGTLTVMWAYSADASKPVHSQTRRVQPGRTYVRVYPYELPFVRVILGEDL